MLKLNTQRTFKTDVTVHGVDESGKSVKGTMAATFKVVSTDQLRAEENADKRLLDLVLKDVHDIELTGPEGNVLQGEALLEACKNDPAIGNALVNAYGHATTKKNLK